MNTAFQALNGVPYQPSSLSSVKTKAWIMEWVLLITAILTVLKLAAPIYQLILH